MTKTVILSWPNVTISGAKYSFSVHPKNGDYEAVCLFSTNLTGQPFVYSIGSKPMGGLTGEYSEDRTIEKTLDKLEAWVAKANKPPRKRANTKSNHRDTVP
jgi:hypothetical protein